MPLMLTPNERAMLDGLSAPISESRRPEFLGAVRPNSKPPDPLLLAREASGVRQNL